MRAINYMQLLKNIAFCYHSCLKVKVMNIKIVFICIFNSLLHFLLLFFSKYEVLKI